MDLDLHFLTYLHTYIPIYILPHYHCTYHLFLMYLIIISICHTTCIATELDKKQASDQLGTI